MDYLISQFQVLCDCGLRLELKFYLNISFFFQNPNYFHGLNFPNDIALIKLNAALVGSARFEPVCLPLSTDNFSGSDTCWLTGWGEASGRLTCALMGCQIYSAYLNLSYFDIFFNVVMHDNEIRVHLLTALQKHIDINAYCKKIISRNQNVDSDFVFILKIDINSSGFF